MAVNGLLDVSSHGVRTEGKGVPLVPMAFRESKTLCASTPKDLLAHSPCLELFQHEFRGHRHAEYNT